MSKGIGLVVVALVSAAVGAGAYHLYTNQFAGKIEALTGVSMPSTAPDSSAVVVTVNGTPITQDMIARRTEIVSKNAGDMFNQLPDAEKTRVIKENLILETLVDLQMKDSGLDQDPAVQAELAEAREQVLRTAYLDKLADNVVTDEMLQKVYDAEVAKLPEETEINARHILVKDEALAKEIIAKLKAGMKFDELAKQYSEDKGNANLGGDLGFFTKAMMVPEFANPVFAMKVGEVTPTPIKTGFGYHVVEVMESRVKPKPSFDEVKNALESRERNRVIKETIQKWRSEAKVEGDVDPVQPAAATATPQPQAEAEAPAAALPEENSAPAPAPEAATAPVAEEATPAPEAVAPVPTPPQPQPPEVVTPAPAPAPTPEVEAAPAAAPPSAETTSPAALPAEEVSQ